MNNGLGTNVCKQALEWLGDWPVVGDKLPRWVLAVHPWWWSCFRHHNFPDLNQKDRSEVAHLFTPSPANPTGCTVWTEVTPEPSVKSSSSQFLAASNAPTMATSKNHRLNWKSYCLSEELGVEVQLRRNRFLHFDLETWYATVGLVFLRIALSSPSAQLRSEVEKQSRGHMPPDMMAWEIPPSNA